jgi:hypothetical protein
MRLLSTLCLSLLAGSALAQQPIDYAVGLSATVSESPASITISWPADANASEYTVYNKLPSDKLWQDSTNLTPDKTSYTRSNVTIGKTYEFKVRKKSTVNNVPVTAYGYIYSGIKVPEVDNRGKIILLIAQNLYEPLRKEIKQLQSDMAADGWQVYTSGVALSESVPGIKNRIMSYYNADPQNFKAVLLLGHIAVPYSGDFNIDGHPDHKGAWPADMYYGDIDGLWPDENAWDTVATRKENWNIPGDGKFDLDIIGSDIDLQVGRIDLSNLTFFSQNEVELTRQYLNKNHAFRTGQFRAKEQAVVEDNFGTMAGEAFGASAYKNFSPMFGPDKVFTKDWKESVTKDTFLCSYGTGAGTYTSAGGIIRSEDFADGSNYNTVFTTLFGSYFGDWDVQNALMRSALASRGMILTCSWSGRPQWLLQHMALGETMGFSTRLSMNDYTAYYRSIYLQNPNSRLTTPALMGDPTLRLHMNAMPANLKVTVEGTGQNLSWSPAKGPAIGYLVYRRTGPDNAWIKVTSEAISDTTYADNTPGVFQYLVRALYLQQSASGTYYNMSQGISNPDTLPAGIKTVIKSHPAALSCYPNPTNGVVQVEVPVNEQVNGRIVVLNTLGAVVYTIPVKGSKIKLNLNRFAKGVYTIHYQDMHEGKTFVSRVVLR